PRKPSTASPTRTPNDRSRVRSRRIERDDGSGRTAVPGSTSRVSWAGVATSVGERLGIVEAGVGLADVAAGGVLEHAPGLPLGRRAVAPAAPRADLQGGAGGQRQRGALGARALAVAVLEGRVVGARLEPAAEPPRRRPGALDHGGHEGVV